MDINEAVQLIKPGIEISTPQIWKDLGCGSGTFTYALAELLLPKSKIYAVDQSIQILKNSHHQVQIEFIKADIENPDLQFFGIDGILMANSLHYIKDKIKFIQNWENYFQNEICFFIVEYNNSQPNPWVPYPIPYKDLERLFTELGYQTIRKTGEKKSVYGGTMYAAIAKKKFD